MLKQYLEAGKIVGTHGLKGEVRIDPWCDNAEFLCKFKKLYYADGTEIPVVSARPHKNIAIVLFKGITSIEQAEVLRGKIVYINRKDAHLPKNTYFIQDIIGLKVFDADTNEEYGEVTDVMKTGANDVYQITRDGKDYLIPVIPDVVIKTDIENGILLIRLLEGIFDDED
ncbi:MAG: ribosome maturation factor RimM [Clostridia bacterium]|nr:ribosome maturation factor RimM [Clostridia bacterium]